MAANKGSSPRFVVGASVSKEGRGIGRVLEVYQTGYGTFRYVVEYEKYPMSEDTPESCLHRAPRPYQEPKLALSLAEKPTNTTYLKENYTRAVAETFDVSKGKLTYIGDKEMNRPLDQEMIGEVKVVNGYLVDEMTQEFACDLLNILSKKLEKLQESAAAKTTYGEAKIAEVELGIGMLTDVLNKE